MATFEELAKIYAERLNNVDGNQRIAELQKVVSDINGLVYTGTSNKLSDEDKVKIYKGIRSRIKTETIGYSLPGKAVFECANDELMVLVDSIISRMGGK